MYVYVKSDTNLWTVGFYDPSGAWCPERDEDGADAAAERVAWLNGSGKPQLTEKEIAVLRGMIAEEERANTKRARDTLKAEAERRACRGHRLGVWYDRSDGASATARCERCGMVAEVDGTVGGGVRGDVFIEACRGER
jgi:hypothetical protein